ncbi:MAG: hypothetical protein ACI9MJ_001014 [Alphaproteobacteria bacterium]|jgi:hypothetical protein
MLGFSIGKLLVLAAIIAIVWYGFKIVGRRNQISAEKAARKSIDDRERERQDAQDMDKCAKCGTFVPAIAAKHCGRADCPYPA